MPKRFVVYVPSSFPESIRLCALVEAVLCEALGGVTSYPAKGTFKMSEGNRTVEQFQVLESYCEIERWAEHQPFLMALAAVLGGLLKQEAIAVAVDGRMQMIPPVRSDDIPEVLSSVESEAWLIHRVKKEIRGRSEA